MEDGLIFLLILIGISMPALGIIIYLGERKKR